LLNEVITSQVFIAHMNALLPSFPGWAFAKGSTFTSVRRGLRGQDDFKLQYDQQDGITVEWKTVQTLPDGSPWAHIAAQVLGPLASLLDSSLRLVRRFLL
jgi:hypothetical protein